MEGSFIYSTLRPCFDCTKEALQAKVLGIHYLHEWNHKNPELQSQYELIQSKFEYGVHQVAVDDPKAAWAQNLPERKPPARARMPGASSKRGVPSRKRA